MIDFFCSRFCITVSEGGSVQENLLSYNRANRQVAILCNHQRAVPKSHEKSMENLSAKIKAKKAELKEAKVGLSLCLARSCSILQHFFSRLPFLH